MGGIYKCGGCGVQATMMDDLSHVLQVPSRTLSALQAIAIAGERGKRPGDLKPFDKLRLKQLQDELDIRDVPVMGKKKEELDHNLKEILKGVQRVPTLLLLNPTQSLTELNLQHYTVLDCEPLHDLKGHLIHLTKELPYLLDPETRKSTQEVISACVSDKMTCADHRVLIMQLFLHLKQQNVQGKILSLLETAIQISRLLYLPAELRSPKKILQMYNCTWVHHELCREIFTQFHAGMTREKMFGNYLHALVAHAPVQYEITPLSSVNRESGAVVQSSQKNSTCHFQQATTKCYIHSYTQTTGQIRAQTYT